MMMMNITVSTAIAQTKPVKYVNLVIIWRQEPASNLTALWQTARPITMQQPVSFARLNTWSHPILQLASKCPHSTALSPTVSTAHQLQSVPIVPVATNQSMAHVRQLHVKLITVNSVTTLILKFVFSVWTILPLEKTMLPVNAPSQL